MKSSSTCSGVASALLAGVLLASVAGCAGGAASPARGRFSPGELTNPRLGPAYAQWLVGPISRLASREEIAGYLALGSDEAAGSFVAEFWKKRDTEPRFPDTNPVRDLFERRAAEADGKLSEGGVAGRRTDRGTIYVLYGAPKEQRFDLPVDPDEPPLEVWTYPADAPVGLDGERPKAAYRFARRGDSTVFYAPVPHRPRPALPPGAGG